MLYILLLICRSLFRHEAGYQPVGDGGTYPDFGEQIVGVFVDGLKVDVVII